MARATIIAGGFNHDPEIDTEDIAEITYEVVGDDESGRRTDGILHMSAGEEYRVSPETVTELKGLDPALADRERNQ